MNKAIKVLLINVAVVIGISTFIILTNGGSNIANDFLISFGLICLGIGILDLLVAVILFITGPSQYEVAKGFLLSGGVLLLASFAACSSASISFH